MTASGKQSDSTSAPSYASGGYSRSYLHRKGRRLPEGSPSDAASRRRFDVDDATDDATDEQLCSSSCALSRCCLCTASASSRTARSSESVETGGGGAANSAAPRPRGSGPSVSTPNSRANCPPRGSPHGTASCTGHAVETLNQRVMHRRQNVWRHSVALLAPPRRSSRLTRPPPAAGRPPPRISVMGSARNRAGISGTRIAQRGSSASSSASSSRAHARPAERRRRRGRVALDALEARWLVLVEARVGRPLEALRHERPPAAATGGSRAASAPTLGLLYVAK